MNVKWLRAVLAMAALVAVPGIAAETYPTKPVRILVGAAAGGPLDIIARVVGQKLSEQLGQPFVVDARGGAGGIIATKIAAQGGPDGYTLLCNSSQYVVAPSLYKDPGYDPNKDFAPIVIAGVIPNILFVHPSVPAKNLQELIALVKARKITSYGSAGTGSTPHLTGERLLKSMAGLDITHVPYSGAAPALTAVTAGQVPLGVTAMASAMQLIRAGKLRGIALTSPQRIPALADVATVAESGYPGYEDYTWYAFFAPAGTPKALVDMLNRSIAAILRLPETRERLAVLELGQINNTPEQFAAYIRVEVTKWAKVIKESGARVD